MAKVAIVILNYLNYEDTIECIDSIEKIKYPLGGIVVVDNGSQNGSYRILLEKYENRKDVHIIQTEKNLGFAKGNNEGISYARKTLGSDFVLVVNNDTVFTQADYLDRMIRVYKDNVAVIGSKITLKDAVQFPVVKNLSMQALVSSVISDVAIQKGIKIDFRIKKIEYEEFLHGCVLMLTPQFFKYYDGFYPKTFLYHEEEILYFMCQIKGLRQVFVRDAEIFHKEDQSSLLSFSNFSEQKMKYMLNSQKYVIWWKIKMLINKRHTTNKRSAG